MSESTPKRILFVDDEPPVLNLLQTLFRHANPEWDSCFADRAVKAISLMEEQPFDVIVTDMRMPEMNGAELLEHVRDLQPRTARIILSGYADHPLSLRSLSAAHQYLSKPFTLAGLQSALDRVFSIRHLVPDPALQQALGAIHLLPSAPSIQDRLSRELTSPAATSDTIGGLLAQDVALSAKALQIVHSAFFGTPRPLTLVKECAQTLGISLLRSLAINHRLMHDASVPEIAGLSTESLARHCVATGLRASRIMTLERATPDAVKIAFTAGVLHGIGRLALALAFPDHHQAAIRRARDDSVPILQAEQEVFGVNHAQTGAYLLGLWGLPDPIVSVVSNLYQPSQTQTRFFGPLTAVHVANYLETASLDLPEPAKSPLDQAHLNNLHIDSQRFQTWTQTGSSSSDD